ncbi:KEOPS complex subunit Pcc1 [Thermococcus waiotapuensis]|uniref:KEOPS complex subunit Pcc1 n=1 Tax=Thermococcus waiotapuensis TaxID=90909 RepID=A0AAE4T209_9EURY|nr:KEOPS complex subunit Pcc1 [Thermococcus waiotapuensis]MDV3103642.1 KEOPS complex subunit Pcc1 [Thermococcus waiotapuensis]
MNEPIEGYIEIEFPTEEVARIVYESVLYEHESVPYRRSRIEFLRDGKKVVIRFLAKDNSALRGTLDSYLRWIKVAMESLEF